MRLGILTHTNTHGRRCRGQEPGTGSQDGCRSRLPLSASKTRTASDKHTPPSPTLRDDRRLDGCQNPLHIVQEPENRDRSREPGPATGLNKIAQPISTPPKPLGRLTSWLPVPDPRPLEWSRSESNRRPPECKSGALPTELRPRHRMSDCRDQMSEGAHQRATSPDIRHLISDI